MNDFSIPKNPIPLINQVILILFGGEMAFAVTILLITFIRNSLSLDATLATLSWVIFFAKAFLVMAYTGHLLHKWLKTSYAVIGNRVVTMTQDNLKSESKSSPDLRTAKQVSVNQSYYGRKFDYGTITLTFSEADFSEPVVLEDVQRPNEVASMLGSLKGGNHGSQNRA